MKKTFVAPCVGGPLAGKLRRMEEGIEMLTIPTADFGAIVYDLKTTVYGEREWRLREGTTDGLLNHKGLP